jgi:sugar lactone lactonase YvrE
MKTKIEFKTFLVMLGLLVMASCSDEAMPEVNPETVSPTMAEDISANAASRTRGIINVTTFAGSTQGDVNGTGTNAEFNYPFSITTSATGNLYLADYSNFKIKKITQAGVVTTFAGTTFGDTNGNVTDAKLGRPTYVVTDAAGNMYITDSNKIKKISSSGEVTTFAGGPLGDEDGTIANAKFRFPAGMAIDATGNLYVVDNNNHKIKKITPAGVVTTLAGSTQGDATGTGASAQFNYPDGLAIDAYGNLYVVDNANHKIKKITPSGVVTTLAGSTLGDTDGNGTSAQLRFPYGVAVDARGNVYITDTGNDKVKRITPTGGVTTLAGSTQGDAIGSGTAAQFNSPMGITVDANGNVFVVDRDNHKIKKISIK